MANSAAALELNAVVSRAQAKRECRPASRPTVDVQWQLRVTCPCRVPHVRLGVEGPEQSMFPSRPCSRASHALSINKQ